MTDLSHLIPVPHTSATDQVFDVLSSAIISFELLPGSKVSEAEVAKQLNVSRQPVRDAFFRLSKQGFLLIRPQRATLITKISEQAVLDAVFIRTALELACIQAAVPKITDAEIDVLRDLLKGQQSAVDRNASAEFHGLDQAFHKHICDISGHGHAWSLIQEQKAHMDRIRFFTLPEDGQLAHDEHVKIFDALAKRDAERAKQNLTQHLGRLALIMPQICAAHSEYFEVNCERKL